MDLKPEDDKVRLAAEKALRRLDETLAALNSGGETQPGKLIALTLLTFETRGDSALGYIAWRDFVLRDAAARLRAGESLARTHALPVEEKCVLLETARQHPVLQFSPGIERQAPELARIRKYLDARFPHWVRRHVHATRWKVADPDVLLIRDACRHRYAWRNMLMDYCIEYADYRLMLTPRSITRIECLRGRLHEIFFGSDRF